MDASEPENGKEQEQNHGVCIHIHSPDNRVAVRDFIEVNIHLSDKQERKRSTTQDDLASLPINHPTEIRRLLVRAAEMLVAMGDQQTAPSVLTRK